MSAQTQLALEFAGPRPADVGDLVRRAILSAGGLAEAGLSGAEREFLLKGDDAPPRDTAARAAAAPDDPWTQVLAELRSSKERRALGQFFTPQPIVDTMIAWVRQRRPGQVVDAGCGTGRFAIAAAKTLPKARVIAIDSDPVSTLLCRARVKELGLGNVEVRCADFLRDEIGLDDRPACFVGNPPYVRHHRLSKSLKQWGAEVSKELGVPFSGLSGLHLYFFLATARRARPGDTGCYLTSAEWLDVRYGKGLRQLLTDRLGVSSLSLLEESAAAFEDAMTSAAITCFEVGRAPRDVRVSIVREFTAAEGPAAPKAVPYEQLGDRWTPILRGVAPTRDDDGLVRLGDIARVHRGVATGANDFFVLERAEAEALGLGALAKPAITSGKQILRANGQVEANGCKALVLLPRTLDGLDKRQRRAAEAYLAHGVAQGYDQRYLCQHRQPWWWLGDPKPPPIIASYMARRPPAFAVNADGLHILNIAHGLYPRKQLSSGELTSFVDGLNRAAGGFVGNGRTYQGGLEKFEPREMEELLVPPIDNGG